MATPVSVPALPGTQTLRLRKQQPPTEPVKRANRHSGLLQDQLRRSQRGPWTPGLSVAFRLLILVRVGAAMYSNIQDCDEVYNFFEPLHYLAHNTGFQTWELSPRYALRSWAYILLHLPPTLLPPLLNAGSKRAQFFAVRIFLAGISSFCEARFYRTVVEQMNYRLGRYLLMMMLFSAGMWNAAPAFLPSSFTMYTTMLASSYYFAPSSNTNPLRTLAATVLFALGAILGWPFALLLAVPFVLEELLVLGHDTLKLDSTGKTVERGEWGRWAWARATRLVGCGVLAASIFIPVIAIDSLAYSKLTPTPWPIIQYNIFSGSSRGPALYGTEPPHFYLLNLALNFNLLLPLSLLSLPALAITCTFDRKRLGLTRPGPGQSSPFTLMALRLAPFYLWLAVLSAQPHKEERFMYPAYPLLCFNAATTLYLARGWLEALFVHFTKSPYRASKSSLFPWATFLPLLLFSLLGISRILALHQYYHAPLDLLNTLEFTELPHLLTITGLLPSPPPSPSPSKSKAKYDDQPAVDLSPLAAFNLTLCYGKEWHRFPSSFHVPQQVSVQFVKSEFSGMLPRKFVPSQGGELLWPWEGTRYVPEDLNDMNREELGRYVDPATCDYLIDLDFPLRESPPSALEPRYTVSPEWERVQCFKFLDAAHSNALTRLLWVPLSEWTDRNSYGDYCLLKNRARAEVREGRIWGSA